MILARQADSDADGEQQPQIREYCVSGGRHRRPAEEVGLTQAQQETRDRQHGDRQHQCPSQLL